MSSSYSRIVVGVDGSEASVDALREAQRIAIPLGATLEALACWEYPQIRDGYELMGIGRFEERARQMLDEAVAEAFGPERPGNVRTMLVEGDARTALLEASQEADLLVVGRRGSGKFGGLLMGSVSSACVARARCPVLVVHSRRK